jgi:DNA-binding FadR family transcriptional regulator
MDLSDSMAARYSQTWLQDLWGTWSLIAAQSAADAATQATPEQIRSLRTLVDQLTALTDSDAWESVAAATYFGLAEASGNQVYGTLLYDLWQTLAESGDRWDVAAKLWPIRTWAQQSLREVVAGIASAEPDLARAAMVHHIRGACAVLDG